MSLARLDAANATPYKVEKTPTKSPRPKRSPRPCPPRKTKKISTAPDLHTTSTHTIKRKNNCYKKGKKWSIKNKNNNKITVYTGAPATISDRRQSKQAGAVFHSRFGGIVFFLKEFSLLRAANCLILCIFFFFLIIPSDMMGSFLSFSSFLCLFWRFLSSFTQFCISCFRVTIKAW